MYQLKSHSTKPLVSDCGFSLIELLVALLLGSLLLAMVISLYVTCVSTGADNLKMSRLRTDLQSIVSLMETDIRRAGYGGSDYLVGADGNKTIDINDDKSCIVYYYNHDKSAALDSSNQMAFSLQQGSIAFKTGVGQDASVVCAATTGWVEVSDPKFIKITKLTFEETTTANGTATQRSVRLLVEGELLADSSYSHSISTNVLVRNLEFDY